MFYGFTDILRFKPSFRSPASPDELGHVVLRISSVLFTNRGRQQNWMLSKLELATFYTIITVFVLLQRDVKVLEAFVD